MRYKGFKEDVLQDKEGLDYEHSVMVISHLATLHAASFCYRREEQVVMSDKYPALNEGEAPIIPEEAVKMLEAVFKQNAELGKYEDMFLDPVKEGLGCLNKNIDHFGVLCHGNVLRENVLFCYRTELESRCFCSGVVFKDLSSSHYGSCVIDLLQFIFTSVDPEVRHNFMADLVYSVYYSNFVKTVASINRNVGIFTMKSFISEFDKNIMIGFLFCLNLHYKIYEDTVDKTDVEKEEISFAIFEENMLAAVKDILHFKMSIRASRI